MGQHIAIYVRISRDRSGRAENVDTQERHCRAYVDRMKQTGEWPDLPVEVYSDNDLTAADPGTYRPDYARLLHDIRAGRVAQLVSADQDRLTRQPSEWEELMPVLVAADITETHGYRDGVTPVELGKRAYGRFKALMGAEYVEGIKVKVNEKLDALAAQGRPGGGHAFGYRRTTNEKGERALEVVPELAEHVRWAASKALAGWSATAIARELDARDVPTVHGGKWASHNVRGMLTAPTVAGLRVHRGKLVGRGNWEPILDEETWRRLCALFGGPRTVVNGGGARQKVGGRRRTARKYLLSAGIAFCGRDGCGGELKGRLQDGRAGKRPIYFCGKCQALGINALPLEEHVRDQLIAWLNTPEFAAALASDEAQERRMALTRRLEEIDRQDAELAARWAAGQLRATAWDAARAQLDAEHAEVSAQLADIPLPMTDIDPAELRDAWDEMTLLEKRHVIAEHIVQVTVLPAKPGAKSFDPDRVMIRFVGQD